MPTKTITENGQSFIDIPGIGRYPIAAKSSQSPADEDMLVGNLKMMGGALTNPEILAGLASILGPQTGGLSLAIPPLVGAGTSLARDLYSGESDPYTMAGHALTHGTVNAIPGAAGLAFKARSALAPKIAPALTAASGAHSSVGAILRTLGELLQPGTPAVAAKVSSKILPGTGGLSAQGVAAMHAKNLVDSLRAILAGGSLVPPVSRSQTDSPY